MANINRVVLVGNLTKDPELKSTSGGTSICKMRIAVNTRRKDETGQWVDKPNYFDVTVWGNQAESCAQYLSKGRPVGIDGRLEWREWEATDGSGKRQAVEIVAESVQFLGSRDGGGGGGDTPQFVPAGAGGETADFPASAADDDIPF
jgi:single-strand DNA-binding protein